MKLRKTASGFRSDLSSRLETLLSWLTTGSHASERLKKSDALMSARTAAGRGSRSCDKNGASAASVLLLDWALPTSTLVGVDSLVRSSKFWLFDDVSDVMLPT